MKNRMKKFKLEKISLIVMSLALVSMFFGNVALAVDKIDVEYPVGTNISGDNIFDANNIYPGWEQSKTIQVKNKSTTDDTNLYFKFDVKGDKKLAKKLKLYVIRKADNSYRIGGVGDRWTLKEADEESLYVDKLSTGESERYKIKIKFDEDAGNEYQGLETKFDIDFTIESETAGSGTEAEILAGEGRTDFTGDEPIEEVAGAENQAGNGGEIAGQENECRSWPKWVWILALAVFVGIFGTDARRNYLRKDYGWKIAGLWTVAAVGFWYYFDKCREFGWFWYGSIIIAIVLHFVFLYYLKKKIKTPKID